MTIDPASHRNDETKGNGIGCAVALVAIGAMFCFFFFLLPSVQSRHGGRRYSCTNNLKQFGIALANYHDTFKQFPPACVADTNGKPIHSWRVLLLPFFEEQGLIELAKQYHFDEPWDGPHNRLLADQMPEIFRCPEDKSGTNRPNYVAIVGEGTAWPGATTIHARDTKDGLANTIAVVETTNADFNWLEPRDLTFDESLRGINPKDAPPSISSYHTGGANFLFADGSVHYLQENIPANVLRGLLTRSGGEEVQIPEN